MNELQNSPKVGLDSSGRKKIPFCACGEDNRNGKFVGFKGHDKYGYCHSCDRTFFPPEPDNDKPTFIPKPVRPTERPISFISPALLNPYLTSPAKSNLSIWFSNDNRKLKNQVPFTSELTADLFKQFKVFGTDKYHNGSAFLYIDAANRIRQVKLMGYDPETGKRIREPKSQIWQPGIKILQDAGEENPNVVSCFYGEHRLKGNANDVYVFESEVTALYASAFYPNVICLATGGKNGCKWTQRAQYSVLFGRNVTFFPDIDAFEEWELKVDALVRDGLKASINRSILLAAEQVSAKYGQPIEFLKSKKFDLRDLLVYKTPSTHTNEHADNQIVIDNNKAEITSNITEAESKEPDRWETMTEKSSSSTFDIEEHRRWLKTLPPLESGKSIRINSSEFPICNLKLFITSRLNGIQAWNNSRRGSGDKALFMRQVTELRNKLSNQQINQ